REWLLGATALAQSGAGAAQPEVTPELTQAEQFFVRDHFAEPELSLHTWKLSIEGRVARPVELTFSDLLESRTVEQPSVLECAGNGEAGAAVSMGVWQGVRLSTLLDKAGAEPSADVLLEGADWGPLRKDSPSDSFP